jgi:hypothetical protein
MLVVCAGMMRSGSTLQYQIVSELIERKKLGGRMGYIIKDEFQSLIQKPYFDDNKIYVVKTHSPLFKFAELVKNKKVKIIYCYRDIRDSWLSVKRWQKFDADLYQIMRFIISCIMPYYQIINFGNIYSSRYENFYNNIGNEVKSIAVYLGIIVTEEEVQSISDSLKPENQKNIYLKMNIQKLKHKQDPKHLLNYNHIYSASTGEWHSELSDYEINLINYICEPWLSFLKYENTKIHDSSIINNFCSNDKIENLKNAIANLNFLNEQINSESYEINGIYKKNLNDSLNLLSEYIHRMQTVEEEFRFVLESKSWRIVQVFQKIIKPFIK